jgi:hypothetical protein
MSRRQHIFSCGSHPTARRSREPSVFMVSAWTVSLFSMFSRYFFAVHGRSFVGFSLVRFRDESCGLGVYFKPSLAVFSRILSMFRHREKKTHFGVWCRGLNPLQYRGKEEHATRDAYREALHPCICTLTLPTYDSSSPILFRSREDRPRLVSRGVPRRVRFGFRCGSLVCAAVAGCYAACPAHCSSTGE